MAKLIVTSRYLKSGTAKSITKRKNYIKYIATRETVEIREQKGIHKNAPASEKQQELLHELLADFPESKKYLEYEDYTENPTNQNASELISAIIERNADIIGNRQNFVGYMALRPGAERRGEHGLFSGSDENIVLDRVASEVAKHKGNVWSHVISLRREDAIRLGYDNSERWRVLVKRHISEIAEQTKIPLCNLKWYGAFHDTTHHPHIHLIVYSTNPKQGYLTKQGIDKIRSVFANDIFHDDLQSIYHEQTQKRDELKVESKKFVQNILNQISQNKFDDENLKKLIKTLHSQLQNCKGKKVYGYLPQDVKSVVNEIFLQLAKNENIQLLYEKWCELERQKYMTYTQKEKDFPPLYENKTFHSVRNMIIKQVLEMGSVMSGMDFDEQGFSDEDFNFTAGEETDKIELEILDIIDEHETVEISSKPYIKWSDEYKNACKLMYKKNASVEEILQAESLFLSGSDKGNILAAHDSGKLYSAEKLGLKDQEKSFLYYKKAFEGFQVLEPICVKLQPYLQYRLGKMYFYGLGTGQNYAQAFDWFLKSAESGNQFAQYSLGSMYYYGSGVEKNLEQAFHWYEKSAKQNNPYAAYSLAKMYHYGEFAEKNMKKAQDYYKIAYDGFSGIEFEDDNLWYKLGGMCKKGLGTDVNIPRAMEYFKMSAELENKSALCEYGMELIKGENVSQDIETGVKLLEKALEKGNLNAAYHLGKLYMDGEFVYMDLRKAEKYLLLSSENSYAQYKLGKLYLNAEMYDINKSVVWFEKAITNDNQYAKYALAKIFIGEEEYRNIPRAVLLLESIAEENNWVSFMLGKLYLFGMEGFPKDEELAIKYLTMSAEQDNEYAQNLLNHMYDFENAVFVNTVMGLFVSLSRCIGEDYSYRLGGGRMSADRKLRRMILEKKEAMGVKENHIDEQRY